MFKHFNKKGQSALEFLTTYGWAFLVALIMIGALAYFGVLDPSRYLPERCTFGNEITCNDYLISETADPSEVKLSLINNVGEAVKLTEVIVDSSPGANDPGCTIQSPIADVDSDGILEFSADADDEVWKNGETQNFDFTCTDLLSAGVVEGTKSKLEVTLIYYAAKSTAAYTHTINGELYAQVN